MKHQKKKRPSDYPQLAFRVSEEDKKSLTKLINDVYRLANQGLMSDEKPIKKNELIVTALTSGLSKLKKKYSE